MNDKKENIVGINIESLILTKESIIKNKIKKSFDFARTFIWLSIMFLEKNKISVSTKQLSEDLISNYSYAYILLSSFVDLGFLKKIKQDKSTLFVVVDRELFKTYLPDAKEIFNGRNK